MIRKIESADLVRYNANSSGKRSPDCVKRALSFAFDIPYSQIAKMLNDEMKRKKTYAWNIPSVYVPVMENIASERGGSIIKVPVWKSNEQCPTLGELVDNELNSSGVYLVLTGKKSGVSDHIVCVRDGKVWDSWDSRTQYVKTYYILNNIGHKTVTNIKDELNDLATYVMKDIVNNETNRYMNKKDWDHYDTDVEVFCKGYQLVASVGICLRPTPVVDTKRYYDFNVVVTIEPTMTREEAEAFIQKAAKQKTYDRMWAINEQEKKLEEEYEMRARIASSGRESNNSRYYYTKQEQKFIDTLPGWVRPLIKFVDIQNPGQYSDSYTLKINSLPDDPKGSDRIIYFEAYEASHIRDMLNRYKHDFEVPGEDYIYSEEY